MNPEEMLTILKSLDEELENAESIHPDHRKSLQFLTREIQNKLASDASPDEASSPDSRGPATLSQQVKDAVIEFEVRHPIIGGLVERLADGLSAMGI